MKIRWLISAAVQSFDKNGRPIEGQFRGFGPGDVWLHPDAKEAQKLIDAGQAEAAK